MNHIFTLTDLLLGLKEELIDARAEIKMMKGIRALELATTIPKRQQTMKNTPDRGHPRLAFGQAASKTPSAPTSTPSRSSMPTKRKVENTCLFDSAGLSQQTPKRRIPVRGVSPPEERNKKVRRPALFGTGVGGFPIPAASPVKSRDEQYPDRVFVTRVSRKTSARDILDYVSTISKKVLKVTRMQTRAQNPTFASFVVELEKGDGKLISDPTRWNPGVAVRVFGGVLQEGQIGEVAQATSMNEDVDERVPQDDPMQETASGDD